MQSPKMQNEATFEIENDFLEIPWELDAGEIVYFNRSTNEWVTLGVR
mgnify:CR=1 FL=1